MSAADSTSDRDEQIFEDIWNRPITPRPITPEASYSIELPQVPVSDWQIGQFEDPSVPDDGPIAHRLRSKHCKCPRIKRDCQIIIENLEVLRKKISLKDCLACGAVRYHLRGAQQMLRQLNEFLDGGVRINTLEDAIAWDILWQKKSCMAKKHKPWTLKRRKNKKKATQRN